MTDINVLKKDPIFQLNLLLWSIMDVPANFRIIINPILRNEGYTLYAIEKKVILPTDPSVQAALSSLIHKNLNPPNPDLWITHEVEKTDLIIELKSRGFRADSDKSIQVMKIMAATADLSETLGVTVKRPGYFVFVTIAEDMDDMLSTLSTLETQLDEGGVPSASTAIIGIQPSKKGIDLVSPQPNQLPSTLSKVLRNPTTVLQLKNSDDEIVPLYLIPWMPGNTQDKELSDKGLQVLTSRLLTHVQEAIGKAAIPSKVILKGEILLEKATFGAFEYWRDRERRKFMKEAIKIIIRATQQRGEKQEGGTELIIDLPDENVREEIMKKIEKLKIEEEANLSNALIPTLFDTL